MASCYGASMADSKPDQADGAGSPPAVSAAGGPNLRSGVQGVAATEFVASTTVQSSWLGRVIDDRYEVTEVLGEGGMGAVFVARHLKLHKDVALKVVRSELAGNGEVAARFAREAMATAQFEHPHVASAIDFGTLPEGGAYFVMQRVRGDSLRAILTREGRLPWRRACELAAQVADALSAANSRSIVHRDLKPENMIVERREDGSELLRILDFGIAHVAPTDAPAPEGALAGRALTRVGTIMGTPGYMSPEQAVGDKVDHRTDLYALGVILWESIAGRLLWDGPDLTSVIAMQMTQPVPALGSLEGSDAPRELDTLIAQLTAVSAVDRPERAGVVRDELRRLAAAQSRVSWQQVLPVQRVRASLSAWRAQPREQARQLLTSVRALPARWRGLPTLQRSLSAVALAALLLGVPWLLARSSSGTAGSTPGNALEQVVAKVLVNPIPEAIRPQVQTMQEDEQMSDRRTAAQQVLDHPQSAQLPAYVLAIAKLEAARSCAGRREALQAMATTPDDRYLPSVERMSRAKTTGCGFLRLGDCFGCVRSELKKTLAALKGD